MTALGCFMNRIVITIFSVLTLVIGIIVIALGSVTINKQHNYVEQFAQGSVAFPALILVFGIFITLNGLCGLCGVVGRSSTCLSIYAIAGMVLFLGELIAGIIIVSSPEITEKKIKSEMDKSFKKFGPTPTDKTDPNKEEKESEEEERKNSQNVINALHEHVKCCGLESYEDWGKKYGLEYPPQSCCKNRGKTCDTTIADLIHKDGCYQKTLDLVGGTIKALGFAAIILAILQLMLIFMACAVIRSQKSGRGKRRVIK